MWLFEGKELQDETIPDDAFGFIYLITHLPSKKKYIGKKFLTSAATKTVNGKKKKIRKPSDWKEYWSSSPDLKKFIEEEGKTKFSREILVFFRTKGAAVYLEEQAIYQVGALESDTWMNANIRSKVYASWIAKDLDHAKELRNKLNTHFPS